MNPYIELYTLYLNWLRVSLAWVQRLEGKLYWAKARVIKRISGEQALGGW